MNVQRWLIGCEKSGRVRDAFRALGHDAWSCDILPDEKDSPFHIQGDVLEQIGRGWDGAVFFPTCTYLCSSGLHWNKRRPERAAMTELAIEFVRALLGAPIDRIALENPTGCISTRIRKADQIIQPWHFGDDASKATNLWLKNLPALPMRRELFVPGRIVGVDKRGKTIPRWANQTDSGQNRLPPSDHRAEERSRTYPGIARAMAETWGTDKSFKLRSA